MKLAFRLMACMIVLCQMYFLTGCSEKEIEVGEESIAAAETIETTTPYFAIISKGWQHQFWQAVKTGAYKASKEYDVEITFEGPEGDFAVDQQIKMVEGAMEKKPDAIILAATDSEKLLPTLNKLQDKNIPIIAFDSGVEGELPLTTVATDNWSAAALAADKLAEAIGKKGEVAVICHDDYSITGIFRRDGFTERIEAQYPDIQVVAIEYGSGDHTISSDLVTKIIEQYPNLKGIFATNEGSAIGLINSVIINKKERDIVIVGFDAGAQQKEAIRQGIMLGAVSQDPVMIGYKAVEAAYLNYTGKTLAKHIYTDYIWYDTTNVDNEELEVILYD